MDNQDLRKDHGRVLAGLLLLAIGCVLFIKQTGFPMPDWLFTWQMLLIVVGLFVGIRHSFRGIGWILMLLIGGINLFDDIQPQYSLRNYMIPIILMALGLFFFLRPHRINRPGRQHWQGGPWNEPNPPGQSFEEFRPEQQMPQKIKSADLRYLDSVSVMGSVRKVIVTKDFKGGEAVAFLGGTEIDMRQADINGHVVLEVTQILGGTKLIIPSHWEVKSEMVAFLGGIEDKRELQPGSNNPDKVLILKGTSILGGIDIRNF